MIEVYVLLTLGALGYLLNSNSKVHTVTESVNVNETPSMRNIYESKHVDAVDAILREKATKKFADSENPKKTGVISNNYTFMKDERSEIKENDMVMSLTGERLNKTEFTHNNMVPFYGSAVRQNVDDKSNRMILENFTGVTDIQKNKCETKSFYDTARNVGNVNGMASMDDFIKDRMVLPKSRNNEFPIPQLQVGPGLGTGFKSTPSGGFHQYESQDYAQEKCVDQLRTKLNPNPRTAIGMVDVAKATYKGRTVDGLKGNLPGETGEVVKNRVNTYFEQSPDQWLKTTAANLKPSQVGKFNTKPTNRLSTTKQYIGTAYAYDNLARTKDSSVKAPLRQQFGSFGLGTAAMDQYGKGTNDDYGKSRIMVYQNERDVTTTRVHQGNLTSLVKAVVAPLVDIIKITKKQHAVDNPRHFGNMNIQVPKKATLYDPNDVARTTVKETTIHDAIVGNLKGSEKITVYDPNDVARTTIKETNIHDEIGTGTLTGAKQLYVYDPEDVARKTTKETVDRLDYEMNMAAKVYKGTVYDPDDTARTTTKETTTGLEREYGNLDRFARGGGYETNDHDAKDTQKQFFSDKDYYGTAVKDVAGGYETNEYDAKDTQKQFFSDIEYFGIPETSSAKEQMSYDDIYNAMIRDDKEVTLFGREPTQTGTKVFNDCVNVAAPRKQQCDARTERTTLNKDHIASATPSFDERSITKVRHNFEYEQDDRLDPSLLSAFKENPFTKPLDSVA